MTQWWSDLADSEIVARLVQRGVPGTVAADWVQWRESTFADEITRFLGDH